MMDSALRESRAAHRQLLTAHDDWRRAFLKARESLKHGRLLSADPRIEERFKRFIHASELFRLIVEKNRIGARDPSMIECSFASLSSSAVTLSRSPPAATPAVERRPDAGVARLFASYSSVQVLLL